MATTNNIKVKTVRVGDPNLTVTLEANDGGTFPAYVKLVANLSNSNLPNGGLTVNNWNSPSATGPSSVTIQCSFPDSSYAAGQSFGYDMTANAATGTGVQFSTDGVNWRNFPGTYSTDGQPWSGTVTSQDFTPDEMAVLASVPTATKANTSLWGNIVAFFRSLFGLK
ncbi:MAG: hypothetical protein KF734_10090 [Saprospiraceae bacterium]|nr:hypothetical protein [Saprospiraceae bacterium]